MRNHPLQKQESLGLAVAHLNASVGSVLTVEQLAKALRAGTTDVIADAPTAAALVSYLFTELEPKLIVLCAREADSDVRHADMLYREGLAQAMPRVPAWENSIRYLV
jgi:hypothetical protein